MAPVIFYKPQGHYSGHNEPGHVACSAVDLKPGKAQLRGCFALPVAVLYVT